MKTMALRFMKICSAVLALSILSTPSYAHNWWSGIYLSTYTTWGFSTTTVSPSDDFIVEIAVFGYLDSYWNGVALDDAFGTNVGFGTAATADTFLWRDSEDWWTQYGTHFFLEDDANTFEEVSFWTIFW